MPIAPAALPTSTPPRFAFARHETFHLRDGWLFKGLNALRTDESSLRATDAHHHLGLGKNMLGSLVYWMQAVNLIEPLKGRQAKGTSYQPTPLAGMISERDPYLEDIRTLWLLHMALCSNKELATFWYWAFNESPQRGFTEDGLVRGVEVFVKESGGKPVASSSLRKDARCFLRTYANAADDGEEQLPFDSSECPLASLGLIRRSATPRTFRFRVGSHHGLTAALFAYCLFSFRDKTRPEESVLSLDDVRWAPFSPGRLLCLDTPAIIEFLEELQHRTSWARMVRTADLNVISLEPTIRTGDLLTKCYGLEE